MSIKKWPGAVVSDTPVEPAGPYQDSAASGVWTLDQQAYWEAQGLWPVPGSTNPDSFIENLFSTYLYAGNSSTQTITNGIDLDGEGGMVWLKDRLSASLGFHTIYDTEGGTGPNGGRIFAGTAGTNPRSTQADGLQSFDSTGFTLGANTYENGSGKSFASWTFRKAPKFFDVVTFTGTAATQNIAHNLGSVPGMIIVKSTTATGGWAVWHNSLSSSTNHWLRLDWTNGEINQTDFWPSAPTDSQFTVGGYAANNAQNQTLVAYLFAHDAGGFGDDGEQNVISCGSFTTDGSGNATVNLGYEPQWILWKSSSNADNWRIGDNMRGWTTSEFRTLFPNLSNAEGSSSNPLITSTGFQMVGDNASRTFIYIAIRRPMKTPESGTEVFAMDTMSNTDPSFTSGFPVDMSFHRQTTAGPNWAIASRLTGKGVMYTDLTEAENTENANVWDFMDGWHNYPVTVSNWYSWMFRRAPGFMDVVAYTTETGSFTRPHNLGVAPEIMILKNRGGFGWYFMSSAAGTDKTFFMQTSVAPYISRSYWPTDPDASNLYLGGQGGAYPYIAYLFASLAGVSKCGSYIGTGADLNVDCGFSSGARFVLIKRYDGTPGSNVGDWYVWDSVRGIAAGNDPYMLLNSNAAEVTSTDYIDPLSSGFTVTSSAPAALNASGGSYIFLAIA